MDESRMDNWQAEVERKIRDAIQDGDTSDLPGAGKPLLLDDDPFTPDDQRIAFKIMRDNNIAPQWIMERRALEVTRGEIMERIARAAAAYRGGLGDAQRLAGDEAAERRRRAEAAWRRARRVIHDDVAAFNKRLLTCNLKLPPGVGHLVPLDAAAAIERALRRGV